MSTNVKSKCNSPQEVVNHIHENLRKGWKISFYVGKFDFVNSNIEKIEDLPPDYEDEDKNIFINAIRHGLDYEGDPFLCFTCIDTGAEYEISLLEWDDRIAYSQTLNPDGKAPTPVEIFTELTKLAKKHQIAIDFIDGKMRMASDKEIQLFCEKYIHINVCIEVPRLGSLPATQPAVVSYSVIKAYWDAYCLENDYKHLIANKSDLIDYMKRIYMDSGIQFVDDQEKIVFAMIKRDMIKKYLH